MKQINLSNPLNPLYFPLPRSINRSLRHTPSHVSSTTQLDHPSLGRMLLHPSHFTHIHVSRSHGEEWKNKHKKKLDSDDVVPFMEAIFKKLKEQMNYAMGTPHKPPNSPGLNT